MTLRQLIINIYIVWCNHRSIKTNPYASKHGFPILVYQDLYLYGQLHNPPFSEIKTFTYSHILNKGPPIKAHTIGLVIPIIIAR